MVPPKRTLILENYRTAYRGASDTRAAWMDDMSSIKNLNRVNSELPEANRGPSEVLKLDQATGKTVGAKEKEWLKKHLESDGFRYNGDGLARLNALAAIPMKSKFSCVTKAYTNIPEQSALAFIPEANVFVAIDDETSIVWLIPADLLKDGGRIKAIPLREDDGRLSGLEGLCYDSERKRLVLVSEDSRKVFAMDLTLGPDGPLLGEPTELGKLPKMPGERNKGWEGLAIMASAQSPDGKAHLLVTKEANPPLLTILDPENLQIEDMIGLPKEHLPDVSDITVDPITKHLFILTDVGSAVCEFQLSCITNSDPMSIRLARTQTSSVTGRWTLRFLGKTSLGKLKSKKKRLQPEGACFDSTGDLWVSAEGDQSMQRLRRE